MSAMIPNVFVSSTIEDLHHLRDAIRDVIAEVGYTPVMSEYGDVGYLPMTSAQDACYLMLQQCQLAVLIIGKRYGSLGRDNLSVTHTEFRTARERGLPVITLIDQDVLAFKRVYDVSPTKSTFIAPGMDQPAATFALIDDVMSSPVNNGVLAFTTVAAARLHLKRQLAHLFGELLHARFDPERADLKDVLSEIKTLRHELKSPGAPDDQRFLRAVRFLVDDSKGAHAYRRLLGLFGKPVDSAVPLLLASSTFDDALAKLGANNIGVFEPDEDDFIRTRGKLMEQGISHYESFIFVLDDTGIPMQQHAVMGLAEDGRFVIDRAALTFFRHLHKRFRDFTDEQRGLTSR